jgi:N-acetylmuramoyl-L-alanine amidase
MPAILAEGGYMMIPEQENAMKTEPFQERYARAVADGLEAYFRSIRSP